MATTRRNGQLSSCEPCRKSKIRCDHKTPICNRCARRNLLDICVYHPAPLTRSREPNASAGPKSRRKTSSGFLAPQSNNECLTSSSAHPFDIRDLLSRQRIADWCKGPFSSQGFFGLTSSLDVFREPQQSLEDASYHISGGDLQNNSLPGSAAATIEPREVQLGAQVLLLLEHIPICESIIEKRLKMSEGWIIGPQFVRGVLEALRTLYDNAIRGSDDRHVRLLELSKTLFQNTGTAIETYHLMELAEYVSVAASRWETMSFFFSLVGSATYQIQLDNALFQHENTPWKDKDGIRKLVASASDLCLQFCDNTGVVSDSLCWAVFQHTVFFSHMYGNGDYRTWQKLGDLTTIVFALGLHQPEPDEKAPFFLAEIRKRTMVGAYALDKELATFLGRPPRICWRYCDIQSPLDISYDELVASPCIRDTALQRLDPRGWNTERSIQKGARARVTLLSSIIRENILELSLSCGVDDLEQKAQELCQESSQMRLNLPSFLHWTEDADNPFLASLHLEFLYQDFLLFRTVVKRTGNEFERLINKSHEIITFLLNTISKHTHSGQAALFTAWDLCYIGLPAAGVLSIELLRHFQDQLQPPLASTTTPIPWSEIIQELSIFAWQLDTFTRQHEGDYEISKKGQMIIRQVLDRVLCRKAIPPEPLISSDSCTSDALTSEDIVLDDSIDFMTWLEKFDWEQEPRLNFSC